MSNNIVLSTVFERCWRALSANKYFLESVPNVISFGTPLGKIRCERIRLGCSGSERLERKDNLGGVTISSVELGYGSLRPYETMILGGVLDCLSVRTYTPEGCYREHESLIDIL